MAPKPRNNIAQVLGSGTAEAKLRLSRAKSLPLVALIELIARRLIELGATVCAFDPEASARAKELLGDSIEYAGNMYEAIEGADALVLVTEWKQFHRPSWQRVKSAMRGHVVFDGRNIYSPEQMRGLGFEYFSIGR